MRISALWRGYSLLGKLYTSRRIQKLAQTVETWESVPTQKGIKGREAGWVKQPHRFEANRASRSENTEKGWHVELCGVGRKTPPHLSQPLCLNMTDAAAPLFRSGLSSTLAAKIPKVEVYRTASFAFTRTTRT